MQCEHSDSSVKLLVGLLGPTTASVGDQCLDLPSLKQRALLAMLDIDVGVPVSVHRLIDGTWGTSHPWTVRTSLHVHVSRLRKDPSGQWCRERDIDSPARLFYSATIPPASTPPMRGFVEQAVAQGDDEQGAKLARDDLWLWRVDALSDLSECRSPTLIARDAQTDRIRAPPCRQPQPRSSKLTARNPGHTRAVTEPGAVHSALPRIVETLRTAPMARP
jgi:hypothetical protein